MILSHSGFQPLKEVWLGNCYPEDWYGEFDSQCQDILGRITEMTRVDLNKFEQKLTQLGVTVRRPVFFDSDRYRDYRGRLCKPPITPRDWALVLNDTLYIIPQYENSFTGFESTLELYQNQGYQVKVLERSLPDDMCFLPFSSTVRVGMDLFVDFAKNNPKVSHFTAVCNRLSKEYRVHVTNTGDHSDGVFCPVAPGKIFSTHYRDAYDQTFPGWQVFWLTDTTKKRISNGYNGRWWVDGVDLQIYNASVLNYAAQWIGDFSETVFEVNMLVIDEKNICVIVEDDRVCRQLESLGFTVHVVDFRCRGFWDGGLHCLTVDIHRLGSCIDYWPDRGDLGIYFYD